MTAAHKITIVGGGLGGLAAANALLTFGFEVEIFEQAPTIGEIGAGISVSCQAVKALRAIGLGEKIAAVGNVSRGIQSRNMHTGEPLDFREPAAARYGAPHYFFHRADLLNALASGIDPALIHLGHRVTGIEERPSGVALTFANGATRQADAVIGADGIHSVVRRALYGDDHPVYTGQMVWRALLDGNDVPPQFMDPTGNNQWLGSGRHLLAYYLRGWQVINIVTQQDTDQWVEEGWSIAGDPDEMRASFPDPEPRLKKLLSIVTQCSKWGLFTRPLTANWGQGRVQLIGDAAHAMLPNAGQGAGQAFEDAYILGRWLDAERNDVIEALKNFRRIRIPRVHGVQKRSLANARMKHTRDRKVQKTWLAKEETSDGMGWIWGFDPVKAWDQVPTVPNIEVSAEREPNSERAANE
jgi:salicylate hydroxylase